MTGAFNIAFALFPNLTQLDFTGPLQVLSRVPGAEVHLAAKSMAPLTTDAVLTLYPTFTFAKGDDGKIRAADRVISGRAKANNALIFGHILPGAAIQRKTAPLSAPIDEEAAAQRMEEAMRALAFNRMFLMLTATLFAFSGAADAASKSKIDRRVDKALAEFRDEIGGADAVLSKAVGVLVFPSVKKAGIGIGGEYGEGALKIGGRTVAYYNTAAASIGFQLGAQARRQIIVFLDQKALDKFRASEGWEIGVDASVAVVTLGAGGAIDTTTLDQPIVAFIFDNKGLMYNLSLEGSKISRIHKD